MLSVVIPTRNDEAVLVATLAALVPGAAEGVVRDVTIADGGSTDSTLEIADLAGCKVVGGFADRAGRLDAAARRAKSSWILFLEPGSVLDEGWFREVRSLVETLERRGETASRAAVFSFGIDQFGAGARASETLVRIGEALTGLPRPEQGLLIHRALYEKVGGFRSLPAMAEADLIRRIGRSKVMRLRARAMTPTLKKRFAGPRAALGAGLLMLRVPPRLVSRLYG